MIVCGIWLGLIDIKSRWGKIYIWQWSLPFPAGAGENRVS
jgi:hypothetical protein